MVSDGMLSQDEIDALLKGTSDIEDEVFPLSIDDYLSMMELDTLGEIGNISFGSSATALSTLLNQKVDITTPTVTLIERGQIAEEFPHPYVAIQVQYTEGFSGINMLVIKQSDAAIIADLMLGGDGGNPSDLLGEIQLSAVQEAMNQMMGSAATSMSTIFSKKVDISPPSVDLLNFLNGVGENAIPDEDLFAKISFRLRVGNLIDSSIMQLLPLEFAKGLVSELLNGTGESQPADMNTQKALSDPEMNIPTQEPAPFQDNRTDRSVNETYGQGGHQAQPMNQIPNVPQHFGVSSVPTGQPVNVQPASFTSFQPYQLQEPETKNLSMLMDIPLQVTVELGRTKRSVKDILELSSGSIIELDKLAGEPVDILVNSRLIAKGEVVVIDENFGVRVTDIMSQSERLNKIK
ncbi:flagellar motor switch phosphatase FliY [Peribacillus castrilensis]|uniref:Flagellar motor switch protein n=1 Tax=Peribacillus simplex TaxID=1478 RepID=A0AAN2TS59_9BACI|nr:MULTISPECIES: flagellar motor switch phosphatase FliY [Bacillaceae]MBD8587320.1 flagellar motor switch phosphatase FliY [Peribacillus simplex]MCF7621764.1 flagellar motor switch phosphatase FliY [Peribacillus frigoritolerans]MCP1152422.1 flagellar motor switch phosphatase FliY [Peribacillus frigoritolerans]MCT1387305.1 flagellar motor switch phosphatase FliY [Peribacillus frigoritolerans]MEA3572854.1 flagellar motor switch phosphatase FliY [Peribacillus frigoritolerans]